MSDELFDYVGNFLIKKDLKRLKKWRSLAEDIKNHHKIFNGVLTDNLIDLRAVLNYPVCDHITQKQFGDETANFYKMRVAVSSPKTSPSSGARFVFAILLSSKKFIPILVYGAFEEKSIYSINNKKIPLQKSGLIKIISEKLSIL